MRVIYSREYLTGHYAGSVFIMSREYASWPAAAKALRKLRRGHTYRNTTGAKVRDSAPVIVQ